MEALGWPAVAASLSLVALVVAVSLTLRLGIERDVVVASLRAAVQLLAVGLIFTAIFRSRNAELLAAGWIVLMVVVATSVVRRRVGIALPGLTPVMAATIGLVTGISLAVTFGFGVLDLDPVSLVVVAGITIGNAVPSAVLGAKQAVGRCRDGWQEVEAALALGFDRGQVVRFLAPGVARLAIIPQVERTKVVGLIALPGAMTGLLLAGVSPIDAVVIQLLVMYLVLGAATLCVVAAVIAVIRDAVTDDLRAAPWIRPGAVDTREPAGTKS